ncbi:type IV pilus assembly protein PilM [Candidatus Omnitrophota bacterium]
MFAKKPKIKIGLDIGSYSIKIVKLLEEKGSYRLTGIGEIRPKETSEKGMAEAIKELAKKAKLATKGVCLSVSGTNVIVRFITIPKMKESDIRNALQFEAEKYIPFNIKDVLIEYQVLNSQDQGRKLDLVLACVKKDYVMKRISMAQSAELVAETVDVDSFALANSFMRNFPDKERSSAIALVNLGASATNVLIIDGNTLRFARDLQIGGKTIDEEISKNMNVALEEAEGLKLQPKDRQAEVIDCVNNTLMNLFGEMRLSLGYFDNQFGKAVSEIYLSGGAAKFPGVDKLFEENMGVKAEVWDPVKFLEVDEKALDRKELARLGSSVAVAVGLALR